MLKIQGKLRRQGMTAHQYGTHTLGGYALQSQAVNLDAYVARRITVKGRRVAGYPLEGGPELVEVTEVSTKD